MAVNRNSVITNLMYNIDFNNINNTIMKSFFIKGTNKQYSIREDGVIIKHYNNTRGVKSIKEKQLGIYNGTSSIYILKKKTTVSISYLLFDYFGFRYCNKCNSKIFIRTNRSCNKCKQEQIKKTENLHYQNNKQAHLDCQKRQRKKLANWYVMSVMRRRLKENIPEYIINAKKQQLLLHRQCKNKNS